MHTQTFIRLPDGRELTRPRPGKTIEIQNVEQLRKVHNSAGFPVFDSDGRPTFETFLGPVKYQEADLFKESMKDQLDIQDGVRVGYEEKFYKKTGESEDVVDGVITISPSLEPRMTPAEYAKKLKIQVKAIVRQQYIEAKHYYDDVVDANSPLYNANDPYILQFETWRATLRSTFELFKTEVLGILQGSGTALEKYQALIDWTYQDRLPAPPVPADLVVDEPQE